MKKHFQILVFTLLLSFFLIPSVSYSCESKNEKSCCKKEMNSKFDKKDCCKKKQSKENGCNGKCGHSNCLTSSISFSFVLFNDFKEEMNCFEFSTKKSFFSNTVCFVSSGFTTVWLPPKIS